MQKTVTVAGEGKTVTQTAKAETVFVTSVVREGGSIVTKTVTSVNTPAAGAPVEAAPTGGVPGADVPAGEPAPATPTEVVVDDEEEWDDEDWSDDVGASASGAPSASATGAFDDGWDFGAASGRPRASIVVSVATASLAMLAGAFLVAA